MSTRPRFLVGPVSDRPFIAPAARSVTAFGDTGAPSEALAKEGRPALLSAPNGFCPSAPPPSVEIFSPLAMFSLSGFPRAAAARANRDIRFSTQEHQRLRIAAV